MVEELCAKASELSGEKIQIANFLCPGNYAVSGAKSACSKVYAASRVPRSGRRVAGAAAGVQRVEPKAECGEWEIKNGSNVL